MSDRSTRPFDRAPSSTTGSRSLGLKLIVILALVVLMAIPVMFISFISFERSSRADDVTREVSQTYGGEQRLLGPILVVPYRETLANGGIREGDYVISASTGDAVLDGVTVEEKSRSLYKVPVYSADAVFTATLPPLGDVIPEQTNLSFDLAQARLVIGLGDVTGLQSDATLSIGQQSIDFEPHMGWMNFDGPTMSVESAYDLDQPLGPARNQSMAAVIVDRLNPSGMTLLSVPVAKFMGDADVKVTARIAFTGANRLSVLPYAKSTTLRVSSDWPHPGFSGRFPPGDRRIDETGFSADWSVPYLRRGLPSQGRAGELMGLIHGNADMQVSFVSPLNPYQTVNRALKYAVLFIGLVFLAYFLMETLLNVRVHPAQYLLIGIAQAVFYLLLLAFAEHIGFTLAFLLSAIATVALTAGYAGAVFGRKFIGTSVIVFGAVYGLLFVLMRIQDFALMVGALVSFVAVAATLYLTRNLNWYGDKLPDPKS